VLRVAAVHDTSGRYYLSDRSVDLPDAARALVASRSRWLGQGAAGLGLHGTVRGGELGSVLSGLHPSGRYVLRRRATGVSGYDLTFSAPKSVSVLHGIGGARVSAGIAAAHEDALEAALGYVAAHAAAVRQATTDGRVPAPVEGLVAASFTHELSRTGDPHLHSHVVVANLARGPDGRWRAVDGRGLFAHTRAAGALYDCVLRAGISARLGLEWRARGAGGFELEAVDPVVTAVLSTRRAEIAEHLHVHLSGRSPSRRARAVAWAATREAKDDIPPASALRRRWTETARDAGWTPGVLERGRGVRRLEPRGCKIPALDEHRFAASIVDADRPAGTPRRDALFAWASALRDGARGEDVARCVDLLADWGAGTGVAEERRGARGLLPTAYERRTLGPRPGVPDALMVWQAAATAIARYRARWGVVDETRSLGASAPGELAALSSSRLADHLRTSRVVDEALVSLGRRREQDRERELSVSRGLGR